MKLCLCTKIKYVPLKSGYRTPQFSKEKNLRVIRKVRTNVPNLGCPNKKQKNADFGPCFWHENKSYRKNELYHEQGLFMPFSKHSWLLFVGFVNPDWQLKESEVILIKILLSFKENFDQNHLSLFWLPIRFNKTYI